MRFQALRSCVRLQFCEEGGREFFGLISLVAILFVDLNFMSTRFCRAVKPPCNQILRIDREGMIDDVTCISHNK